MIGPRNSGSSPTGSSKEHRSRAEHQSRYAPDQRGKSYRRHDHRDNWPAQQLAQHHAFEREAERDRANDSLRAFGLNLNQSKGLNLPVLSGNRRMPEFDLDFTLLLISSGLMIGLMYALIALGFVLVYKATDAINFAQGEFVMFAAIIAAAAMGAALPFWIAATVALHPHYALN